MKIELRDETWKHNNIAMAVIELFLVILSFVVDISDISQLYATRIQGETP